MTILGNVLNLDAPSCSLQQTWDKQILAIVDVQKRLNEEPLDENSDSLKHRLTELVKLNVHRFDPVRFCFIETMLEKTSKNRLSVSRIIKQKVRQALSNYLNDYAEAQNKAASLSIEAIAQSPELEESIEPLLMVGDVNHVIKLATQVVCGKKNQPSFFSQLNRELSQQNESDTVVVTPSFEDELRQQEKDYLLAATGGSDDISKSGKPQGTKDFGELNSLRHFRQSQLKHHSEKRLLRAIQEGPEEPGPLNSQALIIRTLSMMHELSPAYTDRFVSYMDTLFWLEQVGETEKPAKSKNSKAKSQRKAK